MRVCWLVLLLPLTACASANFNHIPPKDPVKEELYLQMRRVYRQTPCTPEKTQLAFVRMSLPSGCSECALYFYRCRHILCETESVEAAYGKTIWTRKCKLPTLKPRREKID